MFFFRNIKLFIRDYFTLTSRERKGAIILFLVITLQLVALFTMHYLSPPDAEFIEKFRPEIIAAEKVWSASESKAKEKAPPEKQTQVRYFPFDPNTNSDADWSQLGMSTKQIAIIRNFLNKGGRFYKKEDLKKIYGIHEEQYEKLESYIQIEAQKNKTEKFKEQYPARPVRQVDLNRADTVELATLPLVGAGRARMIFKYREALGGFLESRQLLEVFTIDSAAYDAIMKKAIVGEMELRKVNINGDTLRHPYLNRQVSRAIVNYRKQHGDFKDITEIKQVALIDDQLFRKLAPYLSIR